MKIAVYNPYLDTATGGEMYTSAIASHWSKKHTVDIFWNDKKITEKLSTRLGINLENVIVRDNIFLSMNIVSKALFLKQYDLPLFLSDGSVPTSFSKHTILHFQVPFPLVKVSKYKMQRISDVVCNSQFTKDNLDQSISKSAKIIYPPVNIAEIKSKKKKKIILSVGRFSSSYTAKKHEILIDAFQIARVRGILKDWKLVIVGGLMPHDEQYFRGLQKRTIGLPIKLIPNISRSDLLDYYAVSTFYWHAAGHGETNPMFMEHFGISTVEAMAAGCIPIVVNKGGLTEIVSQGEDGMLWDNLDELISYTSQLLSKEHKLEQLSIQASKKARQFDISVYENSFDDLLRTYESK